MKILFFSPYYIPYISGITTYQERLFRHLGSDYHITILTFRHEKSLPTQEQRGNTTVVRMSFAFRISKGFISPQSLLEFWRYSRQADMILLNIPNFEGWPLAVCASLHRKPIVSIFHCIVHLPRSITYRMIERFLNMSIALQLSLSDTIVGYTRDYVGHTWVGAQFASKIQTILPPIEPSLVGSAARMRLKKKKNDEVWIGFAGRTAREKGLTYLARALLSLKQKYPTIRLVCAGPYGKAVVGEDAYYKELLGILEQNDIPHTFLGCIVGQQLYAFYETIDVLVLPSINSTEAFGMVQAEAMLSGTPVVTTNLPGVRVAVQETGMGYIVPPKHTKALQDAIDIVIQRKEAFAGRVPYAQSLFRLDNMITWYDSLFVSYRSI